MEDNEVTAEESRDDVFRAQQAFSLANHSVPALSRTKTLEKGYDEDDQEPVNWVTTTRSGEHQVLAKKITLRDILASRRRSMENLVKKEEKAVIEDDIKLGGAAWEESEDEDESDSGWTWDSYTDQQKIKQHSIFYGEGPSDMCRRLKLRKRKCRAFLKTTADQSMKKFVKSLWFHFAREYFTKIKIVSNSIFVFAMIGLISSYVGIYLVYENNQEQYYGTYICDGITTLTCPILLVLIFIRYWLYHDFLRDGNSLSPNSTLWDCPKLLLLIFFESCICLYHVPPLPVDVTVEIFSKEYPIQALNILMIIRLYTLKDVVRNFSGFFTLRTFTFANIAQVKIDSKYVFKVYIERRGFVMFIPFFVFVMVTMGTAVYLLEYPFNRDRFEEHFEEGFESGLHLISFTSTMVGYGDVFPLTELGRVLVVIYFVLAFPVQMAMLTFVSTYTKLKFKEYQQLWALDYVAWLRARTDTAVNVIRRAWMAKTFALIQRDKNMYESIKKSSFLSQILPDKYDAILRGKGPINVYEDQARFRELRCNHPEKPSLDPNNYLQQIIVLSVNEDLQETIINRMEIGIEGACLKMEEICRKKAKERKLQQQWQHQVASAHMRIDYVYALLVHYQEEEGDGQIDLETLCMVAQLLGLDTEEQSNFFQTWFKETQERYGEVVTADTLYLGLHKYIGEERRRVEAAVNQMRALIDSGKKTANVDRLELLKDEMTKLEDDEGMLTIQQFTDACVNAGLFLKPENYRRIFEQVQETNENLVPMANFDDLISLVWEAKVVPKKERTGKPNVDEILADLRRKKHNQKEKIMSSKIRDKKTDKDIPDIKLENNDDTLSVGAMLRERIRKRNEELGIGVKKPVDDDGPMSKLM